MPCKEEKGEAKRRFSHIEGGGQATTSLIIRNY